MQLWEFKNLVGLEIDTHVFICMHIAQNINKNAEPMAMNFYI